MQQEAGVCARAGRGAGGHPPELPGETAGGGATALQLDAIGRGGPAAYQMAGMCAVVGSVPAPLPPPALLAGSGAPSLPPSPLLYPRTPLTHPHSDIHPTHLTPLLQHSPTPNPPPLGAPRRRWPPSRTASTRSCAPRDSARSTRRTWTGAALLRLCLFTKSFPILFLGWLVWEGACCSGQSMCSPLFPCSRKALLVIARLRCLA